MRKIVLIILKEPMKINREILSLFVLGMISVSLFPHFGHAQGFSEKMRAEEEAEQAILEEAKKREAVKKERLYSDVAKIFPDLAQHLEKATDPESQFALLMELLPKIEKQGSDRATQLYLADQIAEELGPAGYGDVELRPGVFVSDLLPDWEAKHKLLSKYGVTYFQTRLLAVIYNHVFLKKIIDEGLTGYWAEEASLDWILMGSDRWGCHGPEQLFKRVIARGEDFLRKNPKSHVLKEVRKTLAEAHETGWSLSMATNDEYVRAEFFRAEAPNHLEKAIFLYEQFLQEYPDSPEVILYRGKLKRLRMGLDTNSRRFYCIDD